MAVLLSSFGGFWDDFYADGHKGIVFKIDFSGLEKIYKVKYSEKLPWGLSNTILGFGEPIKPHEVLSRKTKHWEFESEYRIIHESEFLEEGKHFDIKGRIKAVYLGTRISTTHRDLLTKIMQGKIPIYTTKINEEKIIVVPDRLVEGREKSQ